MITISGLPQSRGQDEAVVKSAGQGNRQVSESDA